MIDREFIQHRDIAMKRNQQAERCVKRRQEIMLLYVVRYVCTPYVNQNQQLCPKMYS